MSALKIRKHYFSGTSLVFDAGPKGLAAIIRGLAIDNARKALLVSAVSGITDNTGGTASSNPPTMGDLVLPAVYDASAGATGAQATALAASLGKIANARDVFAEKLNSARARLGLPDLSWSDGTIATSGTLPALDLAATAAQGTAAVDYTTGYAALQVVKQNQRLLVYAFQEVMHALGITGLVDGMTGSFPLPIGYAFTPVPAIVAAAAPGSSSIAQSAATAFLQQIANNFATLAALWNQVMVGAGIAALTDNTGGTASNTIAAIGSFAPYTSAGTDMLSKANFDTELGKYRNSMASLAAKLNAISEALGLGPWLVDNTAGAASGTLAALDASFTAVNANGVDVVSANVALTGFTNNVATLAAATNSLGRYFGVTPLTDNSGGTPSLRTSMTQLVVTPGTDPAQQADQDVTTVTLAQLVTMPTTAAAVSGAANGSVAETQANTILAAAQNAIESIAAKVNAMLGASADFRGLSVVAA